MEKTLGNKLIILVFVLPAVLIFTCFVIYPLLPTIYYSLHNFNGIKNGGFVGLKNYLDNLKDPVFWNSNLNSLKVLAVQYVVAGPLSFIFAVMIHRQSPGVRRFFKTTSFIPSVLNVSVICLMWKMMLQPDWGLLDIFLKNVGLQSLIKTWLVDPSTAMWVIAGVCLWQYIGYNMMFFYGGLKAIPGSYYEAASIEGANPLQQTLYITIPLLQEIIKFVLILSTAGTLSLFGHVTILTNGGPGDLTRTLVFQLYYHAFSLSDFGGADAMTVIFAFEGMLLLWLISRFIARERIIYT